MSLVMWCKCANFIFSVFLSPFPLSRSSLIIYFINHFKLSYVIYSGIYTDFRDWWHHTNEELSFWQSWNSISSQWWPCHRKGPGTGLWYMFSPFWWLCVTNPFLTSAIELLCFRSKVASIDWKGINVYWFLYEYIYLQNHNWNDKATVK